MKTTTKFAIGSVAVIALSAGVAGVTAYAMMEKNQANASFMKLLTLRLLCVRQRSMHLACSRSI